MRLPIKEACLAAAGLLLTSCNGPVITNLAVIHYTQVGACTQFLSPTMEVNNTGNFNVIVVFRIASIDNTASAIPFPFDPQLLYEPGKVFVNINTLLEQVLENDKQAQLPVSVAAQMKLTNQSNQGLVTLGVHTVAANGLSEAAHTSYNLYYDTQKQPGDPGVVLVKDNANAGSWPTATECQVLGAPITGS